MRGRRLAQQHELHPRAWAKDDDLIPLRPGYDAAVSKKPAKSDALADLQTLAAAAVVEYETVAKDKTLRRVKADALAVARGFAALATGAFAEALAERDELVAAATRIEAAVEAREEKLLGPDDAFPSVPGINRWIMTNLLGDCRKILDARARAATSKPKGKLRHEDEFWEMIERVRRKSRGELERACDAFKEALRTLDDASLFAAARLFGKAMRRAYRWDVWGAAYVIHGGCSDDAFWDFRAGLIALGRARYEAALAEPDSLAAIRDVETLTLFEGFQYCPGRVIEERELVTKPAPRKASKPAGRAWKDDAALAARFPRLSKRFG